MSNCWAIAIGINQYQFFEPLNYAQRDAQALRDFLVEEARLPASQCVLLTDSAEAILAGAPVPSRDTILEQVATVCQTLRPDDVLWVFFSGYGVRMQGRDYLIPIDGHPKKLPLTAIAADELFKLFERAPQSHIVVALDINRSQGMLHGQGVGDQAILLAERQNRVLFLSCQPDQFSQETLALRHGFFTAALLEGLRYENCLTPESLSIYLSERLPELTEHHWRPVQNPAIVLPETEKYSLLLPQEVMLSMGASPSGTSASLSAGEPQLPRFSQVEPSYVAPDQRTPFATAPPANGAAPTYPVPAPIPESTRPLDPASPQASRTASLHGLSSALADPFWRSLLLWGSVITLALLAGVIVRNRAELLGSSNAPRSAESSEPVSASEPPNALDTNPNPLQQAIAAIGQPADATLAGQVTAFANGVAIAQAIPPSDPTYADAQTHIQRWQLTILDLANAQAAQGDYRGAIASVQSVLPTENLDVQTKAQQLIVAWETAADNQALLEKAYAMAQPDQASTLNEAIGTARMIPEGQPFYAEAQAAIEQWSQAILALAAERATAENYDLAVLTARLVPPGTGAYDDAQTAIAQWQEQALQQAPTPSAPVEAGSQNEDAAESN